MIPVAADLSSSTPDWRHAVTAAAELLVGIGTAPADYPRSCLTSIEEHGPYIVIAPGVALVHAQVAQGTSEGLTVLRLDEPVEFGHPRNDPVDVLLAFSSGGDHMGMIRSVASGLSNGLAESIRGASDAPRAEEILKEVLDG